MANIGSRSYQDFQRGDETAAVAFLAQLAGPGPALELGIGTGRIALPLAARGIRVDGIDLSPAMVDQLRARPGGDRLSVGVLLLPQLVPQQHPIERTLQVNQIHKHGRLLPRIARQEEEAGDPDVPSTDSSKAVSSPQT